MQYIKDFGPQAKFLRIFEVILSTNQNYSAEMQRKVLTLFIEENDQTAQNLFNDPNNFDRNIFNSKLSTFD